MAPKLVPIACSHHGLVPSSLQLPACSLQTSACTQLVFPFPLPWPLQPFQIWKPGSLEEFIIFISDFPILH